MVLVSYAPLAIAAADDWDVAQLMTAFTHIKARQIQFREEKYLAVLEKPLILQGTLHYRAPDYLKKQIIKPRQESYEIQGNTLRIEKAGDSELLDINAHPALQALTVSLRATLAGDLATLQRFYQVRLLGKPTDWTLELEPLEQAVADYVAKLILAGQGNQILRITTLDAQGDATILRLTP